MKSFKNFNISKVYWNNHSSVLISYKNNYILTDPFYNSTAFETWLPTPPSFYHPAYLLALSKSNKNFFLIISHGHDDHLDDRFLKLFTHCKIFITKMSSPGLFNRLKKIGFNNIIELTNKIYKLNFFELSSFINFKYSHDDSVQVISTPDTTFVHANDCWWPIDDSHLKIIKKNLKKITIYASQVAVADAYPFAYDCFSSKEKLKLSKNRIKKSLLSGMKNAKNLKSNFFLPYAGHIKTFSKNEEFNDSSGFVENNLIKKILKPVPNKDKVNFLDWKTGDVFKNGKIHSVFENNYISEINIKKASSEYWSEYGDFNYKKFKNKLQSAKRKKLLNYFSTKFQDYVINSVSSKNFKEEILYSKVILEINNTIKKIIIFPEYTEKKRIDLHVKWDLETADQILQGKINFEASYIGGLGTFSRNPKYINNSHVIRWLTMFGYVWQNKLSK